MKQYLGNKLTKEEVIKNLKSKELKFSGNLKAAFGTMLEKSEYIHES